MDRGPVAPEASTRNPAHCGKSSLVSIAVTAFLQKRCASRRPAYRPSPLIESAEEPLISKDYTAAEHRSLNAQIIHLLWQAFVVNADSYRDARGQVRPHESVPVHPGPPA